MKYGLSQGRTDARVDCAALRCRGCRGQASAEADATLARAVRPTQYAFNAVSGVDHHRFQGVHVRDDSPLPVPSHSDTRCTFLSPQMHWDRCPTRFFCVEASSDLEFDSSPAPESGFFLQVWLLRQPRGVEYHRLPQMSPLLWNAVINRSHMYPLYLVYRTCWWHNVKGFSSLWYSLFIVLNNLSLSKGRRCDTSTCDAPRSNGNHTDETFFFGSTVVAV